ncbi:unnamed protein product [Diabrotica balteata]|uniref:Uncharacterized protein n=1 Tax=Diabrotica balteata TaxID=107213 RepID=A0A9N9SK60_DIABA|nr:unnamed protein product [Diabrotica balteata]
MNKFIECVTDSVIDEGTLTNQLEGIRTKYQNINTLTETLNEIYSTRILFLLLSIELSLITNTLFFARQKDTAYQRKQHPLYYLKSGSMLLMNVAYLTTMCVISSLMSKEAQRTVHILHTLKNRSEDLNETMSRKIFTQIELEEEAVAIFASDTESEVDPFKTSGFTRLLVAPMMKTTIHQDVKEM